MYGKTNLKTILSDLKTSIKNKQRQNDDCNKRQSRKPVNEETRVLVDNNENKNSKVEQCFVLRVLKTVSYTLKS